MWRFASAIALVLLLAACGGGVDTQTGDLLLTADRLFDGHELHEPGALLMRGRKIVAVGRTLKAEAARTIELGDATILPGFIDLHVHDNQALPDVTGVTTVRDLGEPLELVRPTDENAGVRVIAAGPLITVPGGYPTPVWGHAIALDVTSAAGARWAVGMLARRGAGVIKIALQPGWRMLSAEEVRAIVQEAHAHKLRVTAHAPEVGAALLALDGGVDELAHCLCGAVSDDVFRRLIAADVEIVGTLHVMSGFPFCSNAVANAARFVELGGTLLYGTDFGNPGIPVGIDIRELQLMREAGLEPDEVLAAATADAGEQLERAPLGSLVDGAPADVLAVNGDARELDDDLETPLLVIRAGRILADNRR